MYPAEYRYSPENVWVRMNENVATLGLTEYAQMTLGQIVFVELPEVGQSFQSGDEIGTIESVKAVGGICTLLGGEIVAINDAVVDDPELVNEDPHGEGWLVKIRIASAAELDALMSAEQYENYVKSGG